MRIFDTHAHYDDEAFDEDRAQLLENLLANDIETIINVGASIKGTKASIALANQYSNIYAAAGVHPDDTPKLKLEDMLWLERMAKEEKKVVAIGEIGLDYYYPEPERHIQKEWFIRQLEVAVKIHKPVIIHSRDAYQDTFQCLKETHTEKVGGVIHCYSYTKENVKDFLNLGFYFGIGGVVTFKNAKKIVEAVEVMPMDRILLETDCPYLAPVPNRGKRNNSGNLTYVVDKIAEIKGISPQEVIDITNQNANRLFLN
jgi:TatD DNase family protein